MQSDRIARGTGIILLGLTLAGVGYAVLWLVKSIEFQDLSARIPDLLTGLATTLYIAGLTYCVGSVFAIGLLFLSRTHSWVARIIHSYGIVMRSTPVLAQLYLVYYGAGEVAPFLKQIGLWSFFKSPLSCVMLVFLLNTTAYQSSIFIGCVANVARGQREAAQALGLSEFVLLWRVILPQALRSAVRPLGNELVGMIKSSSVASIVTVHDLLGTTQLIYSETFNLAYFVVAALVYFALVECVRALTERAAKNLEFG